MVSRVLHLSIKNVLLVLFAAFLSPSSTGVNYVSEVKPILSEHCYRCHGSSQQKGNLRVDTALAAKKGGESGPAIKPGSSAESLLMQVIKGLHPTLPQMPYKKQPLAASQVAALERWIDSGAHAPDDEQPQKVQHWAFHSPSRPILPSVKKTSGVHNPIDLFIRARLERENILPSLEADRATLLRRLSLDLIGLPPTPDEIQDFLDDPRPNAYERQVERLLASPHYGERWARWWLDAARYADSNGYSIDAPRQVWPWRDWVITSLNGDLPFNQFAIEQIAGDLLPSATLDQKIATGFNRNTQVNQEGGIDPEQFRVESIIDRVNTFSTVFLGLTIACAQCHDHKFDPISQEEYYQLYAFFNNTIEEGHGKGAPEGMLKLPFPSEAEKEIIATLQATRAGLQQYLESKQDSVLAWEKTLTEAQLTVIKDRAKNVLAKPWAERSLEEKRALYSIYNSDDPEFKKLDALVTKLEKQEPKPITTLVMVEQAAPRETRLLVKGDFTRPGKVVTPGTPASLHSLEASEKTIPNRLHLANWVVDTKNPLTARVIVNRVWQQYFGKGIVETENDFGTQGALPTHPELLDWLALEFMQPQTESAPSWSLKHLHRLIVTSATYRQSSKARPDLAQIDPNNRLLARQLRLRLDAETVRDLALAASGTLSPKVGGPPVFPPQPDGVMALGQVNRPWNTSTGSDRYRRALYTHLWRATPHPALSVFDAPDGYSTCTRRLRSNTPLQALTLLNDLQFHEFAQFMAQRLIHFSKDPLSRIDYAFRLCLGRSPTPSETRRLLTLVDEELKGSSEPNESLAWLNVARVMLNLDEAITRE